MSFLVEKYWLNFSWFVIFKLPISDSSSSKDNFYRLLETDNSNFKIETANYAYLLFGKIISHYTKLSLKYRDKLTSQDLKKNV